MNQAYQPLSLLFDAYPRRGVAIKAKVNLPLGMRLLRDGLSYGLPAGLLWGSLFESLWLGGIGPSQAAAVSTLPAYYTYWALFGIVSGMAFFALNQAKPAASQDPVPAVIHTVVVPEPIRPVTGPLRRHQAVAQGQYEHQHAA